MTNDTNPIDPQQLQALRTMLRSHETATAAEYAALARARAAAIAAVRDPWYRRWWPRLQDQPQWLAAPAALVLTVAFALNAHHNSKPEHLVNGPDLATLEFLASGPNGPAAEAPASFYQELGFYRWLQGRRAEDGNG